MFLYLRICVFVFVYLCTCICGRSRVWGAARSLCPSDPDLLRHSLSIQPTVPHRLDYLLSNYLHLSASISISISYFYFLLSIPYLSNPPYHTAQIISTIYLSASFFYYLSICILFLLSIRISISVSYIFQRLYLSICNSVSDFYCLSIHSSDFYYLSTSENLFNPNYDFLPNQIYVFARTC